MVEGGKNNENVYSKKLKAGKRRTYFFDIRKTKSNDYFIAITESTKKFEGDGYERHKIFVYKEDFNRFLENLQEVVNEIKVKYLPDFDYDAYARREEEWQNNHNDGMKDEPSW
ncbi:MAG: DUF3276 family protein [Saprospiraceae bacterium]|nr:DUF3276 family protein [Saprospiraceae bacterium]